MSDQETAAMVGQIVLELKDAKERLDELQRRAQRICEDFSKTAKILCPESGKILSPSVPENLPTTNEVNSLLTQMRVAEQTIQSNQNKLAQRGFPSKF